jgi:parallel beta-helix repeat protein
MSRSVDDMCFATVQAAIDDVNDFDEIEVMPGTHYETLDFKGEPFTLRSTRPYKWDTVVSTVIDANDADDGVTFDTGEDANSILEGLTITGGNSYGVYCSSSTPAISNCIIRDNDNGIKGSSATPTIKNSIIYDNAVGIEFGSAASAAAVSNNTIVYNSQQGIYVSSGTAPTIANCIFWGNDANDLDSCSATYSCIEDGDPGTGNISSDPCFADPCSNDYHLNPGSACINAGDPCYTPGTEETDIDGDSRVLQWRLDIGADETTGPVSYWKFDESSGTTAYDSVGGNDGTLTNDPCWTTGKIDGAIEFDGNDDYVKCQNDASLDITDKITIVAWIYADSTADAYIVAKRDGGSLMQYGLFLDDLKVYFYTYYSSIGGGLQSLLTALIQSHRLLIPPLQQ